MKILKNLIKMPFTMFVGIIGVIMCAKFEIINIFIIKPFHGILHLPTIIRNRVNR